jgi:hypothetical protein
MKVKPLFNEIELEQLTDYQLVNYVNTIFKRLGFDELVELNEQLATKVTKEQYIEFIKAIHVYLEHEVTEMMEYLLIMWRLVQNIVENEFEDILNDYNNTYIS